MTIYFLSQLNLTQIRRVTLYKLHCCTCSPPNFQEKRYGLLFSHLISLILNFIFVSICVGVLIFFRCYGFVSMFLGLFLFGLLRYCSYANLFQLIDSYISCVGFLMIICCLICDSCIIICWFLLPILLEPNTCGSFVLSDFSSMMYLV